jgi:hypothetical protein
MLPQAEGGFHALAAAQLLKNSRSCHPEYFMAFGPPMGMNVPPLFILSEGSAFFLIQ